MNASFTDAATVPLVGQKPLLLVDADEVLLAFARGLDRFLEARDCLLDLTSYRLKGNIRHRTSNEPLLEIEVAALLDEFRDELDWLDPVEGACEAIARLKPRFEIVVISNITKGQAGPRLRNLARLGFDFPLLANDGAKGRAVHALARRSGRPTAFVDDIPAHHESVAELAPDVFRIHFVGDERLKPLMPVAPLANLRANSWAEIHDMLAARAAHGVSRQAGIG